jgi:hypothetical protein
MVLPIPRIAMCLVGSRSREERAVVVVNNEEPRHMPIGGGGQHGPPDAQEVAVMGKVTSAIFTRLPSGA